MNTFWLRPMRKNACSSSKSSRSKVTDSQLGELESDWPLHCQSVTMTCLISNNLSWIPILFIFLFKTEIIYQRWNALKAPDQLKAPSMWTHTQQVSKPAVISSRLVQGTSLWHFRSGRDSRAELCEMAAWAWSPDTHTHRQVWWIQGFEMATGLPSLHNHSNTHTHLSTHSYTLTHSQSSLDIISPD